jgi:hypothetical protein
MIYLQCPARGMPQIDCHDCGKRKSNTAMKCPHCGAAKSWLKDNPWMFLLVIFPLLWAFGVMYTFESDPDVCSEGLFTGEIEDEEACDKHHEFRDQYYPIFVGVLGVLWGISMIMFLIVQNRPDSK